MPQSRTVLVVDDEDLFRSSVADALGLACPHYDVLEAADGHEALERLDSSSTDVVLTDLQMPGMGGMELLLALRERSFPGSVITLTAYGNPRLEKEVHQGGAFAYVEKPVDLNQLIQLVRETAEGYHSYVEGLTLQGFSQLIAMESKTCRLRVFHQDIVGDLFFAAGDLVDARLNQLSGDAAALDVLSWEDDIRLELHNGIRPLQHTISSPFNHLLMEAMRLKDEGKRNVPLAAVVDDDEADFFPAEGTLVLAASNKEYPVGNVNESLKEAMSVDGAIGISLVDFESGMTLGQVGGDGSLNLDIASAGNTAVVRAKLRVMKELGLEDTIEDILISLGKQYHLIRPLQSEPNLFLYFALDRDRGNLGMARHRLNAVEKQLVL